MKNKNRFYFDKKAIPALIVFVVLLGVVGTTIALSKSRSVMSNQFHPATYTTAYTDTFDAPSTWITCQTVDKTFTVTNSSSSSGPVGVRVKIEEQWLDSRDRELPLVSENTGLTMAQIHFTENSGWTKDGLYYYYDADLAPGETTTSLVTGVTLNCDANLDAGPGTDNAYSEANYHLRFVAQTIEAEHKGAKSDLRNMIASKSKQCEPNWRRGAKVSDDPATANCNGVNEYTEKGQTVYYYRGHIEDNTVIWGDKCWKIMRTTYTGGVKLVYYTEPSTINGVKQCTTRYNGASIIRADYIDDYYGQHTGASYFPINYYDRQHSSRFSPGDAGYMYGAKVYPEYLDNDGSTFIFSKGVSRNGSTYTLDTADGQSMTGTWNDYDDAYMYFCTDGVSSCESSKIGVVLSGGYSANYYYPIGGYDDYDDFRNKMFENNVDSIAKQAIEGWFEDSGLAAIEDDLEDAIFCNDRKIKSSTRYGFQFDSYNRFETPSLDCPQKNDAFTKSDTVNGNGALGHKVGLLTADEIILGGQNSGYLDTYLANESSNYNWTMTPISLGYSSGSYYVVGSTFMFSRNSANDMSGFRPSVSLKAGAKVSNKGEGTELNPYIVEF